MSMKNSNDTIGNRTRDLPTCSAVPQPTAPPRAPKAYGGVTVKFHEFLDPTLDGSDYVASLSGTFIPKWTPSGAHYIGGPVGFTPYSEAFEKKKIDSAGNQITISRSYSSRPTYYNEWAIEALKKAESRAEDAA